MVRTLPTMFLQVLYAPREQPPNIVPAKAGSVADFLAMTADCKHGFALSRHDLPELCINFPPKEGVGNAGRPVHPQPRVRMVVTEMHTSIHSEVTGITRHSRTQWFTAYTALSPEIGLSCLRRLRRLLRKLDASVEASGPHDFAVRVGAARQEHVHVHRISSRVRDDRDTPLLWNETGMDMPVIWVGVKPKYFLLWDSTAQITPNLARRARAFPAKSW
jgi:hypothetical protein